MRKRGGGVRANTAGAVRAAEPVAVHFRKVRRFMPKANRHTATREA